VNLAFCLFRYFPFGGLQRDFLKIALECRDRGHRITVFTMAWQGEVPDGFNVRLLPVKGLTNAARCRSFAGQVGRLLAREKFDCIVGFNKIPGLDVYFAADPCFAARVAEEKSLFSCLGRRCRIYLELERALFSPLSKTRILILTDLERERYIKYHQTPAERFVFLPPGISRDRVAPPNAAELRAAFRRENGLTEMDRLALMVGSGFRTKGLDRSLRAIAALPESLREKVRLMVIGAGDAKPFVRMARKLGIEDRVSLLGPRDDVPRFLLGADLLLHPSYTEAAGMVLLEAMAAGLPILATDVCGYAFHVREGSAGKLIPSPFDQEEMNRLFEQMLFSDQVAHWRRNGLKYVTETDIFSMPERAAHIIEQAARPGGTA
jgi:UDP-glucose:(heptosyl)LPS alpha-1,3-glucosyltransferase